jgi:hypothetical protein
VNAIYAALSATLAESRDAVSDRLDRGLRRTVFTLSALMVATAAVAVLVVRLVA